MFSFLVFACVVAVAAAKHHKLITNPLEISKEVFQLWKEEWEVHFDTVAEEASRYLVFAENVAKINVFNAEGHTWTQGLNAYTHLTYDEFNDLYLMTPQDCSATEHNNLKLKDMGAPPASIDYRDQKVVSEVKNQGSCGSCWSFSTTGCLESAVALATGQLTLFSEQNLVDCAGHFDNHGCNGGLPSQAFEYIHYNGGIDSEFSYHYFSGHSGRGGNCQYTTTAGTSAGKVLSVYNVTEYDEDELYQQVGTVGPVSICFDVVSGFHNYNGGVYSSKTCGNTSKTVNHAVLAVGYGTDSGQDYWTVKNSWGWNWGVDGYFKIVRGHNMCGVAACASYPIVSTSILA